MKNIIIRKETTYSKGYINSFYHMYNLTDKQLAEKKWRKEPIFQQRYSNSVAKKIRELFRLNKLTSRQIKYLVDYKLLDLWLDY